MRSGSKLRKWLSARSISPSSVNGLTGMGKTVTSWDGFGWSGSSFLLLFEESFRIFRGQNVILEEDEGFWEKSTGVVVVGSGSGSGWWSFDCEWIVSTLVLDFGVRVWVFLLLGFEFSENFLQFLVGVGVGVIFFFFFCSLLCCLRIENLITQKLHLNSKSHFRNLSLLVLFGLPFLSFIWNLCYSIFWEKVVLNPNFFYVLYLYLFFLTEMG